MTIDQSQPHRPEMVPGYGINADAAGLLPWSWLSERMAAARNYWLATVRPDGLPHVAPIWGVWLDDQFYFGTDRQSVKGRNLAANPAAVVHLESGDEVVVLEGRVVAVTDAAQLERYADAYEAKYAFRPGPPDAQAVTYCLHAAKALAWLEHDFPNTATRWEAGGE